MGLKNTWNIVICNVLTTFSRLLALYVSWKSHCACVMCDSVTWGWCVICLHFFSDIVSIRMGNGFVFSSVPEVKTELHLFVSIRLRMVKPKTNAQLSSTTYGND